MPASELGPLQQHYLRIWIAGGPAAAVRTMLYCVEEPWIPAAAADVCVCGLFLLPLPGNADQIACVYAIDRGEPRPRQATAAVWYNGTRPICTVWAGLVTLPETRRVTDSQFQLSAGSSRPVDGHAAPALP